MNATPKPPRAPQSAERPVLAHNLISAIRSRLSAAESTSVRDVRDALALGGIHLPENVVAEWLDDIDKKGTTP